MHNETGDFRMLYQFISSILAVLFLGAAAMVQQEPIVLVFLSVSCAAAFISHAEELPYSIRITSYILAIGLYIVSLCYIVGGLF